MPENIEFKSTGIPYVNQRIKLWTLAYFAILLENFHKEIFKKAYINTISSSRKTKTYWFKDLTKDQLRKLDCGVRFIQHLVRLKPNKHINHLFSREINHCLALDYTFIPDEESKTNPSRIWSATSNLKYKELTDDEFQEHMKFVCNNVLYLYRLFEASLGLANPYFTSIPREGDKLDCIPKSIFETIKEQLPGAEWLQLTLNCEKPAMKEVPFNEKLKFWSDTAPTNIAIPAFEKERPIVLLDDMYQSGLSLWSTAKVLNEVGGRVELSMACAKSWNDQENTKN